MSLIADWRTENKMVVDMKIAQLKLFSLKKRFKKKD